MKKLLSLSLVAILMLSLTVCGLQTAASAQSAVTTRSVASAVLMGDLNEDGRINNRDLGLLQQHLADFDVTANLTLADLNGDGRINNRDLGLLQQYLADWDVEFVTPTTTKPTTTTTTEVTTTTTTVVTPDTDVFDAIPDSVRDEKVRMMLWWNPNEDDSKTAIEFEALTGIQITYEISTLDKYQASLAGKIMAGNSPSVAAIINEWYPQPITRGMFQPIKHTGWDYTEDIYATNLMDQFSYKGEQYGVALKGSLSTTFEVMFFNRDLLKSKGIEKDPYQLWKEGNWNWDTCLEIAKKCTDAAKGEYGLTLISQYYWMLSAGQDFVLSDITGLKNNIKSSALLDTWYYAWDMIWSQRVVDTSFTGQHPFCAGTAAMFGGGSYFMQANASHSNYVPQNCKFDWGVVPFPSPKGMAPVSACEGTVWGFPSVNVSGDKLQAAMWYLRYYLDADYYVDRDFYANEQCWEVYDWMWEQPIQSYNSAGVVSYGGKYTPWTLQYYLIDEATTKAQVKSNLGAWYEEIEFQINLIQNEL